MKNIYKIIIVSLLFINCKAQSIVDFETFNQGDNSNKYFKDINNNFANFTGTWQNTTGNLTFRVNLWKVTKEPFIIENNCYMDIIKGSYQIIQDMGTPNETVLHNSVKTTPNGVWEYIINIGTSDGVGAGGSIDDNCAVNATYLTGRLTMMITNPGASPPIAHWTVVRKGPTFGGATFTVPTDIILTKIN